MTDLSRMTVSGILMEDSDVICDCASATAEPESPVAAGGRQLVVSGSGLAYTVTAKREAGGSRGGDGVEGVAAAGGPLTAAESILKRSKLTHNDGDDNEGDEVMLED